MLERKKEKRTQHILPVEECQLQEQLNKLLEYSEENQMLINGDKSKVMLFNTRHKFDFLPQSYLDVVEELKLFGVHLRSDMKC